MKNQVEQLKFVELKKPERSRTYVFPGGDRLTFKDVMAICVRESGTHRLRLGNGTKVIIAPGWLAIELDVDEWSF